MTWEQAVEWYCAQPERADDVRATYLDEPIEAAASRYRDSAEFRAIRPLIGKTPGRALDLGAGNGILSFSLASLGWAVTAVEPDPSTRIGAGAIRRLSEASGTPIAVIEAFGEAIPLEQAGFDLVIARQVLHHARELDAFCAEMARLVRPGGQVITLRDHVISGPDQMDAFLERHPLHHLYGGENAFTIPEYRGALERAGLILERQIGSFDSPLNSDPITVRMLRSHVADTVKARTGLPFPAAALALIPEIVIRRLATIADRRPGRLVSFVARRPVPAGACAR